MNAMISPGVAPVSEGAGDSASVGSGVACVADGSGVTLGTALAWGECAWACRWGQAPSLYGFPAGPRAFSITADKFHRKGQHLDSWESCDLVVAERPRGRVLRSGLRLWTGSICYFAPVGTRVGKESESMPRRSLFTYRTVSS